MPRHVVIGAVLVGIREERDGLVVLLPLTLLSNPHLDAHVDACQLEAHIRRGLDRVVLRAHSIQVVQNVLAGARCRPAGGVPAGRKR